MAIALGLGAAAAMAALTGDNVAAGLAEAGAVAGWSALASARRAGPYGATASCADVTAASMSVMAAAEALRLAGLVRPGLLIGIAPGLEIAAAALVIGAAIIDLHATWRLERSRTGHLSDEITLLRTRLDDLRHGEHERLHDVRSALAGVRGATSLLGRGQALAQCDRDRLQRMIDSELGRLTAVLESESTEPCVAFELQEVLEPVIQANLLTSPHLTFSIGDVCVWGRPQATATALDNVLANARTHAPGARIAISVRRRDDVVDLVVDDDGPGIPAHERRVVHGRGVRGSTATAPGSGLGLHIVASTLIAQGGGLELTESPFGGLRAVLTLQAAMVAAQRVAG